MGSETQVPEPKRDTPTRLRAHYTDVIVDGTGHYSNFADMADAFLQKGEVLGERLGAAKVMPPATLLGVARLGFPRADDRNRSNGGRLTFRS